MACPWCHNPEGIESEPELLHRASLCILCGDCARACPEDAIQADPQGLKIDRERCTMCLKCVEICPSGAMQHVGNKMSVDELMQVILRDRMFYEESGGGVTFSGGEPFLQPKFLNSMLDECKKQGIRTAVDTSCFVETPIFLQLLPKIDLVLFDLKLLDEKPHQRYTGVSNKLINDNITEMDRAGTMSIMRIPLIPGINDDKRHVLGFARIAATMIFLEEVHILPYHDMYREKVAGLGKLDTKLEFKNSGNDALNQLIELLEAEDIKVVVGG